MYWQRDIDLEVFDVQYGDEIIFGSHDTMQNTKCDGRTDARTHTRTDRVIPIYPHPTGGGIIINASI